MTHVTRRLTAKNRDQLRNPTLGNRVWATFLVKFNATYLNCRACFQSFHARSLAAVSSRRPACSSPVFSSSPSADRRNTSQRRPSRDADAATLLSMSGVRAVSRLFCAGSLLIAFVSETLARARYVESISGFQQPTPTKQLPSTRFAINEPAQLV